MIPCCGVTRSTSPKRGNGIDRQRYRDRSHRPSECPSAGGSAYRDVLRSRNCRLCLETQCLPDARDPCANRCGRCPRLRKGPYAVAEWIAAQTNRLRGCEAWLRMKRLDDGPTLLPAARLPSLLSRISQLAIETNGIP